MKRTFTSRRKQIMMGNRPAISYAEIAKRMMILAKHLTRGQYVVLMSLLYRLGSNSSAWPSHATIAHDTGLSRRVIQTAINDLVKHGLLRVIKQFEGREQITNRYELLPIEPFMERVGEGGNRGAADSARGALRTAHKRNGKREPVSSSQSSASGVPFPRSSKSLGSDLPKRAEGTRNGAGSASTGLRPYRTASLCDGKGGEDQQTRKDDLKQQRDTEEWVSVLEAVAAQATLCGFQPRPVSSLLRDVRDAGLDLTPREFKLFWDMRLFPRMADPTFFSHRADKNLGLGWLFKGANLAEVDAGRYGGAEPPLYSPGQQVVVARRMEGWPLKVGQRGTVIKSTATGATVDFGGQQMVIPAEFLEVAS